MKVNKEQLFSEDYTIMTKAHVSHRLTRAFPFAHFAALR